MSFMGRAGKVLSLAAIAALFLSVAPGVAYDPRVFPGKGNRADWEKACALTEQGIALAKQGKHQEAQRLYDSSLAIYQTAVAYFCYANDLKRIGKTQESVEKYSKAISIAPDYYESYVNMADAYLKQKNYKKAEVACRNALLIENTAGAMINLAEACMGTGRISEAEKWLENAGKCFDAELPNFKSALKVDYEKLRSMSKAKQQAGN